MATSTPRIPNPHVCRGNPSVGQVWCSSKLLILADGGFMFCVINKVDLYLMRVWYTPVGCNRPHESPIQVFKDDWIFSH